MSPSRLLFTFATASCLLWPAALKAQDAAAPFEMPKQYSTDLFVTTQGGNTAMKTFVDGDKIRNEMKAGGQMVTFILRRDKHVVYQLMNAQKMATEMPLDPNRYRNHETSSIGPQGQFELIGPEAAEGVNCTKYKVTSKSTPPGGPDQVFFFWLDTAQNLPVEMMAQDGSFTVKWKNFKIGPQPATLFEIPPGYMQMAMPQVTTPGMGGAGH